MWPTAMLSHQDRSSQKVDNCCYLNGSLQCGLHCYGWLSLDTSQMASVIPVDWLTGRWKSGEENEGRWSMCESRPWVWNIFTPPIGINSAFSISFLKKKKRFAQCKLPPGSPSSPKNMHNMTCTGEIAVKRSLISTQMSFVPSRFQAFVLHASQ